MIDLALRKRGARSVISQKKELSAMPCINSVEEFESALKNGPFAWPGGYPLYFVTADCDAVSFDAVKENAELCKGESLIPAQTQRTGGLWRSKSIGRMRSLSALTRTRKSPPPTLRID